MGLEEEDNTRNSAVSGRGLLNLFDRAQTYVSLRHCITRGLRLRRL